MVKVSPSVLSRQPAQHGAILRNHGITMAGGYGNYHYIANFSACQNCPIKESCCGNRDRKSLSVTMYYREYERMEARLTSEKGKLRRSAVVEPVTVRRRGRELTKLFWDAPISRQRER